ncbi:unnamed protein product [Chondrus crispus]|uniref:Uncharacterized protein n=1 Tax=Chondrus crispus TaxID=2769 RepID=R7QSD9_CHOCR|nr:unnamed protein product [Chondrus crispus]CDF40658.1 unnamed protein product [Chondrus crispus]|eukprot:XP_005710952.1 unnamed protein product [Chondrus crispus]
MRHPVYKIGSEIYFCWPRTTLRRRPTRVFLRPPFGLILVHTSAQTDPHRIALHFVLLRSSKLPSLGLNPGGTIVRQTVVRPSHSAGHPASPRAEASKMSGTGPSAGGMRQRRGAPSGKRFLSSPLQ